MNPEIFRLEKPLVSFHRVRLLRPPIPLSGSPSFVAVKEVSIVVYKVQLSCEDLFAL